MKIKAKHILAQDFEVKKPILESVPEDEINAEIDQEISYSDTTKLESTYSAHGEPNRLRLLDSGGDMWDVLVLPNGKIGIEKIEPVIQYLGIKTFDSWEEAQNALPEDWDARGVNAHTKGNPYVEKDLDVDKD